VIYKALHKGNVNFKLMAIERSTSVRIAEPLRNEDCSTAICLHLWHFINENKCVTAVRIPTKVIDENLWNPRRLRVPSVNKTAQAVVLPSIKGNLRLLWEMHTKVTGFNRC